jgi:PAS domain S-box-containing protein
VETGLLLARERSIDGIVQASLNAGCTLSGAQFGVFCYEQPDDGPDAQAYRHSGTGGDVFAQMLASGADRTLPVPVAVFRSDDITINPPAFPLRLERGAFALRSLLAIPVEGPHGYRLGAIFFGHSEPGRFTADGESLVATVAAQAAIAIENARLTAVLTAEISHAESARKLQRETSQRLEQIFDAMTDGVALLNREWIFTYINRAGAKIVGHTIAGRRYDEVFPGASATVFRDRYAEAMSGRHVEFVEYYAPLDIWASVRAFPTPEGIAIFFEDVTRHRRSEVALSESARRLRQALDAGALGTWRWDAATDQLDLDERAAELLFSEPHLPVDRSELRRRIVHNEDLPNTLSDLREVVNTGGLYGSEYRVEGPDKVQRWIAARGIATYGETQEFTGIIGTVQDITARKTQEAVLRQSEKLAATGRLAATIAHEINNPLEAVTNLIYICRTDPAVPPHIKRLLETADDELARVTQIAQQTLGFYRDTTRPASIDLSAMLLGIVDLFGRKLQFKRLTCRTHIQPGLHIFGLQGEIRQVFSNLLVNAIEASQNSELLIRARTRSISGRRGVSCLVVDRGTGVPAQMRERLFSPFITSKHSLGTGLGLWVTRGIVEKHGGTIHYRTRTEDPTGTVFRVFLPAEVPNHETLDAQHQRLLQ